MGKGGEGMEQNRTEQAYPGLFSLNSYLTFLGGGATSNNFHVQVLFDLLCPFDSQGQQCSFRKP